MRDVLLLAAFGGLMVSLIDLLELHRIPRAQRPDFSDWLYWIPYVGWPGIGVVLALAYSSSGVTLNGLLAVNIGVSAPLILKSMAAVVPGQHTIDPGPGA